MIDAQGDTPHPTDALREQTMMLAEWVAQLMDVRQEVADIVRALSALPYSSRVAPLAALDRLAARVGELERDRDETATVLGETRTQLAAVERERDDLRDEVIELRPLAKNANNAIMDEMESRQQLAAAERTLGAYRAVRERAKVVTGPQTHNLHAEPWGIVLDLARVEDTP